MCGHGPTGAARDERQRAKREGNGPSGRRSRARGGRARSARRPRSARRRRLRARVASTPSRSARARCVSMYADGDSRVSRRASITCKRRAQRPCLDDRAVAKARSVSCSLRKPSIARPERDVRRRCVLRLQRDEPRDGGMHRDRASAAEHLPQQQRAVQLRRRASRRDGGLEQIARRIREERRQVAQQHTVRDQPLPRICAAREERERRAHGRRRVVERRRAPSARRSGRGRHRPAGARRAAGRRT